MTGYSFTSQTLPSTNRIDIIEPPFTIQQYKMLDELSPSGKAVPGSFNKAQDDLVNRWSEHHAKQRENMIKKCNKWMNYK